MRMVCVDLEGVLVPEIWIKFSETTGIDELRRTKSDEPDYDRLMAYRIDILAKDHLTVHDIQNVIASIEPLEGALEFLDNLRQRTQVVILSDTFTEFANPLMKKLHWPAIFCNSLEVDAANMIVGYRLRQRDGKRKAVAAMQGIGFTVLAAGDSYNDLTMIRQADRGALFRAPQRILEEEPDLPHAVNYAEFEAIVGEFLNDL